MYSRSLKIMLIFGICLTLIAGIGATYSFFVFRKDTSNIELQPGDIAIEFVNNQSYVNVSNAYPISDDIGKIYPYFANFSIEGITSSKPINYEIQISPNIKNTIDTRYIKIYLTDKYDNAIIGPVIYDLLPDAKDKVGKVIYTSTSKEGNFSDDYHLRVWIDKTYKTNVKENFNYEIYLYSYNS